MSFLSRPRLIRASVVTSFRIIRLENTYKQVLYRIYFSLIFLLHSIQVTCCIPISTVHVTMNKLRSVDTGTWSFHSSEEVPHISREEEEEKNKSLGWSIVATDSMSDDDRNSSFLDPMIVWTRSQSRTQKVLYGLGALAIGFIVASSILVFQKWGLSSESSSSSSSSSSTSNVSTPSSSSANEDLSSNPTGTSPLLWKTKRPTAEPLTAPSFPPHLNIYPHMNLPPHLEFSTSSPTAAPEIKQPTTSPTKFQPPTYVPGNLTTLKLDLLLSDGLDARILATAGAKVEYDKSVGGGGKSKDKFHGQPDAGATFSDVRPENPGGWIYVSNSEIDNNKGGVGALTFDKDGNLLDYKIVLKGSSMKKRSNLLTIPHIKLRRATGNIRFTRFFHLQSKRTPQPRVANLLN